MTYLDKIKDQFLEQFLPEQLIKELENEAEYIRKYMFVEIEKHNIELKNALKAIKEDNSYKDCLEDRKDYESGIEMINVILSMEPKYLALKIKFKDDTGVRLSLAKDWNLYMKILDCDLYSNDWWKNLSEEEKKKNEQKSEELDSKLKEIQNRFERLIN